MNKARRNNSEIIKWACIYLQSNKGLIKLENDVGVSHSTMWWCFTHRLKNIDYLLYRAVKKKLEINYKHK